MAHALTEISWDRPSRRATKATALDSVKEGRKRRFCLEKGTLVLTAGNVILGLKVAVGAVTVLLVLSLAALLSGRYRLHGRINIAFFFLTLAALVLFEVVVRIVRPGLFDELKSDPVLYPRLEIHLCFAVPSALLMGVMLFTGLKRSRRAHLAVAWLFGAAWIGTFVTGIFFLRQ